MTMKMSEIRSKKPDALDKEELKLKKELMSLQAQVAMGTTPKSPGQVRSIKKALARINTFRREQTDQKSKTSEADNNGSDKR
ncbi:MAG: 50S ribosomal protein L29 [Candidatus Woesearchaeota archaeon]